MNQNPIQKNDREKGIQEAEDSVQKPKGALKLVLSQGYPIALIIITIINVIAFKLVPKDQRLKFWLFVSVCSIDGYVWGILMMNLDPAFEAWRFWKWNDTISFFNMDLLDWFFYPVCGILQIYVIIITEKCTKTFYCSKKTHIILNSILTIPIPFLLWFFPFLGCGWTLVVFFYIPGMVFLWIKRYNPFVFYSASSFLILLACFWDVAAVTSIPRLAGLNVSQWYYIDSLGNHSNVFLSIVLYPWAWIGNSPLEITPFFSIVGAILIFGGYNFFFSGIGWNEDIKNVTK